MSQYDDGYITAEERKEAVTSRWDSATEEVGQAMERQPRRAQPDLHDGQLGSPRLVQADPPAGRHARPDGQSEGRDHRAADQGQLHGGPLRPRVLHLDPRRPEGTRRHGAPHRGLGLSDPAPGRRLPGRDRAHRGLQDQGPHRDAALPRRRRAQPEPDRPCGRQEVHDQARPRPAQAEPADRLARGPRHRRGLQGRRRRHRPGSLGAQVRGRVRHLPPVLRRHAGDRIPRRDRRRGRHHRRAVDRRAGHPAHDADLPHRRCRRAGHHSGSAACRRALRGAQAEGPRADRRGRRQGRGRGDRQGRQADDHRRQGRGARVLVPAADEHPGRARQARREGRPSSTRARSTRPRSSRSGAAPTPRSTSSPRCSASTAPRASTSTTSTSS